MDEIEYKLNTNSTVLVLNGIHKLLNLIKSKYKPDERQKFVLENEELKYLRQKCSSKSSVISLTACQGLLALVEFGVLEIGHTLSTVVTLLHSSHNYCAIVSTISGLLVLHLKQYILPGNTYKCQFSMKSPQHPFITVLEKKPEARDEVLAQMHRLCTHHDYIISSNSLELLKPVFVYLMCNPQTNDGVKAWKLLLSLPKSPEQDSLLLKCISCQQMINANQIKAAFEAYSALSETALDKKDIDCVGALLPMLARLSNALIINGLDPRACYGLMEKIFNQDAPELRWTTDITIMLLAENLTTSPALYLYDLFNLCLNILERQYYCKISLSVLVSQSLQWLHSPSHLTDPAMKVASKIVDTYQNETKQYSAIPKFKPNSYFDTLLPTDGHLYIIFMAYQYWENIKTDAKLVETWLNSISAADVSAILDLVPFLFGLLLDESVSEESVLILIKILMRVADGKKELSVQLLPVLLYKITRSSMPKVKLECLKNVPLMAKSKVNVPTVVSFLNKLKANKGAPTSFLIMLYSRLAETQVRCFPYLQEILVESALVRADDVKWEADLAKAIAIRTVCENRPSQGVELVPVISQLLTRCSDMAGSATTLNCLSALGALWRGSAVAPPTTWKALQPKMARDTRPKVQIGLCRLLSEVPSLRVSTSEYDKLVSEAARFLWSYTVDADEPEVIEAACEALSAYKVEDLALRDIPEIFRRTVKLPASFCKTPVDAARKPEDVLDYIPCEVWPEVFRSINQLALQGVQKMMAAYIEREVKGYRSGVYRTDTRAELATAGHLPHSSVVRGLLDCFKKQLTKPTYDYPDTSLLAMLQTLTAEYSKPLPPIDLTFLHDVVHRGSQWKLGSLTLAARQAQVSESARRMVESYLQGVDGQNAEESDILLVFGLLPILSRHVQPNALRSPVQTCLYHSYQRISHLKAGDLDEDHLFIRILVHIKESLDGDKIHEDNKMLLSQMVENYYSTVSCDNVAWPTFARVCASLATNHVERMTSPGSWWEVSSAAARAACSVRCELARRKLDWLDEIIDLMATVEAEQEYSFECMSVPLKQARLDEETRQWYSRLMARVQVAFNESEKETEKVYFFDMFVLATVAFSKSDHLEMLINKLGHDRRQVRRDLLPNAVHLLCSQPDWDNSILQLLEWLSHTRDVARTPSVAMCCHLSLLALRHTDQYARTDIWKCMEKNFGDSTSATN